LITDYEIELAAPKDAFRIAALSRDEIEYGLPWNWRPRRVAKAIADKATNAVVARHGDSLAGFAIMQYGDDEAHVVLFAVHPAHRRKGVGTALLSWLEATARTAGIESIWLEARERNIEAIAFYRKHGFTQLNLQKAYYLGVENAVRMAKDLWLPPE
jgi:ribosomal-protein-alanine N-acetyltransferase